MHWHICVITVKCSSAIVLTITIIVFPEQGGGSSGEEKEVRQGENRSHGSEWKQGKGGNVCNVCSKSCSRPSEHTQWRETLQL